MKFERTEEYNRDLFLQALSEKNVIKDATIDIRWCGGKYKAYCFESDTYLQFPRHLRDPNTIYTADVIEVVRGDFIAKYYRVVKKSIRIKGTNEVIV